MPPFAVTRLDHVTVLITDMERSLRFYRDLLGLKPIPKPSTFDFEALWFDLGDHHLHCVLKEQRDVPSARHFALRVDDVATARAYFLGLGQAVRETTVIDGADRFFIADPDGNRIEIIQWFRPYLSE